MYQNRDVSLITLANVLKYQLPYRRPLCSVTRAIKYDAFGIWSVSYRSVRYVLEMFSVGRCSSAKLMQIKCHRLNDAGSSANKSASAAPYNRIIHRTVGKVQQQIQVGAKQKTNKKKRKCYILTSG